MIIFYSKYLPTNLGEVKSPKKKIKHNEILYWATESREVDEPFGFWTYSASKGTHYLGVPSEMSGLSPKDIVSINSSFCGKNFFACSTNKLYVFCAKASKINTHDFTGKITDAQWAPNEDLFFTICGSQLFLFNAFGEIIQITNFPCSAWGAKCAWLGGSGQIITVVQTSMESVSCFRYIHTKNEWSTVFEMNVVRPDLIDIDIFPQSQTLQAIVHISSFDKFVVSKKEFKRIQNYQAPLSVSPLAKRSIFKGPQSLRSEDGVSLYAVNNQDGDSKYLRFFWDTNFSNKMV